MMRILINIILAGVLLLPFRSDIVIGKSFSKASSQMAMNDRLPESEDDSEEEEESDEEDSREDKDKEDDKPKPRGMMGNKTTWDPNKRMFVPKED
ncbi:MAG: hypothetical protein OEZ36_11145 [Spirochaetota bacterium]|nr:hypothetical protein [Spirochaetota bacterium]